ncbi:alpha/beta fold hydrolase [Streptomyces sp. CHD11]|uniref:alpha/beta fold hydrolase n=1 Tax=Streptomyces sp. CHD11 TaxID=2741325 RepID=UPI001BFC99D5|nr:alpha/beta fold hydrolase [Streptomyces sp. CHD11]MBT3152848.1 alpha/beta fold hydrolase [Streptomyces sp. CHD11]
MRTIRATAVAALCCAALGAGLVGCESDPQSGPEPAATDKAETGEGETGKGNEGLLTGTAKIQAEGLSVNVSCSGDAVDGRPVVVLMAGLGDGLDKLAGIQKTLSEKGRVCSYDRPGEGASDQPAGPQTVTDTGKVLTAVLDKVAGDGPVVLAGHSLGGLIAARYAPDHQDRVKGLVLMDATSPTTTEDVTGVIPESATGPGAQLRAQVVAVNEGQNPEKLAVTDAGVRSAGDIPVEVIQHGVPYLSAVPEYGPGLERGWADGQRKWLEVSGNSRLSTAEKSDHEIYTKQPALAVQAIERVTEQAASGAPAQSPRATPTVGEGS